MQTSRKEGFFSYNIKPLRKYSAGVICLTLLSKTYFSIPFSRARVLVVRSHTSEGPKYWIAPGYV